MKIEVLSIDGLSLAAEAWRLSRDVTMPIEWDDIYTVDSPCCEMPSAFCHFKDFMILEREILASSRTHVMWARTSFVDSPDKYQVPRDVVVDKWAHAEYRRKMEEGKAAGQHQDEWRRFLPLSATTSFTMRVSYRDAIKFAKYFMYLCDSDWLSSSLRPRFVEIVHHLVEIVDMFTGSRERTHKAIDLMSLAKLLNEESLDLVEFDPIIEKTGVIVACVKVPVWIRAHFVRHRIISIADDFLELLKMDDVLNLTIETSVNMTIAATKEIWRSLLGKRSCWLTQSTLSAERDPWQNIIDKFLSRLGDQVLPCASGECPYHRDARNRLEGTDPGIPCPRYVSLNHLPISNELAARIEQALKSRGRYWTVNYHPSSSKETDHDQAAI
jgi:hypothetical protein